MKDAKQLKVRPILKAKLRLTFEIDFPADIYNFQNFYFFRKVSKYQQNIKGEDTLVVVFHSLFLFLASSHSVLQSSEVSSLSLWLNQISLTHGRKANDAKQLFLIRRLNQRLARKMILSVQPIQPCFFR